MAFDFAAVKKTFFSTRAVTDKLPPAVRKALSKFGAFVRQRAKSSIRTRKAISLPGQPPSSHDGTLKRNIYFGYDPARKSVVIGPTLAGSNTGAPERLEDGGLAVVKPAASGERRVVTYRARPYMGPAFQTELNTADRAFLNLIT